jgi:hypothetical protein
MIDPTAAILPKYKSSKSKPITNKAGIPKYQIVCRREYFSIPAKNAFNSIPNDNGRTIKGSAILGMNEDINAALEEARGDLQSIGCTFIYKGCQNVDTVSKYILLGVPKSIDEDEIKKVTDR